MILSYIGLILPPVITAICLVMYCPDFFAIIPIQFIETLAPISSVTKLGLAGLILFAFVFIFVIWFSCYSPRINYTISIFFAFYGLAFVIPYVYNTYIEKVASGMSVSEAFCRSVPLLLIVNFLIVVITFLSTIIYRLKNNDISQLIKTLVNTILITTYPFMLSIFTLWGYKDIIFALVAFSLTTIGVLCGRNALIKKSGSND